MKQITKHQLGIPTWHEEKLDWRRSYLEDVKSGKLVGKEFKTTKGKRFICEKIDKDFIYFHNIKMERRFALFYLPTTKQYTEQEQIQWLKKNYPVEIFSIGQGCQLHGDVDAYLKLKTGEEYTIPWNY